MTRASTATAAAVATSVAAPTSKSPLMCNRDSAATDTTPVRSVFPKVERGAATSGATVKKGTAVKGGGVRRS
jgi:hypothetical protein